MKIPSYFCESFSRVILPMRSASVTPTTAMLFSTLDFVFLRRQKSKVSHFRTSRPLHGAISRLPTLCGRFAIGGILVKLDTI